MNACIASTVPNYIAEMKELRAVNFSIICTVFKGYIACEQTGQREELENALGLKEEGI